MKFRITLPALTLLTVQLPVGWAVWMATIAAKRLWTQDGVLDIMEISIFTHLSIRFGLVIPIGMVVASVVLLVCTLRKGSSHLGWAFGLATAEIVMVALFSIGIVEQGLRILIRMGN